MTLTSFQAYERMISVSSNESTIRYSWTRPDDGRSQLR
jgi:hypothetical protein